MAETADRRTERRGPPPYDLGIDMGTTFTAAAVRVPGESTARVVRLERGADQVPSVVLIGADGRVEVGLEAEHRASSSPERVVREYKRRLGDETPMVIDGSAFSADGLAAETILWAVEQVVEIERAAPRRIAISHPAGWGVYRRKLFVDALAEVGLDDVVLLTEPAAAALAHEAAGGSRPRRHRRGLRPRRRHLRHRGAARRPRRHRGRRHRPRTGARPGEHRRDRLRRGPVLARVRRARRRGRRAGPGGPGGAARGRGAAPGLRRGQGTALGGHRGRRGGRPARAPHAGPCLPHRVRGDDRAGAAPDRRRPRGGSRRERPRRRRPRRHPAHRRLVADPARRARHRARVRLPGHRRRRPHEHRRPRRRARCRHDGGPRFRAGPQRDHRGPAPPRRRCDRGGSRARHPPNHPCAAGSRRRPPTGGGPRGGSPAPWSDELFTDDPTRDDPAHDDPAHDDPAHDDPAHDDTAAPLRPPVSRTRALPQHAAGGRRPRHPRPAAGGTDVLPPGDRGDPGDDAGAAQAAWDEREEAPRRPPLGSRPGPAAASSEAGPAPERPGRRRAVVALVVGVFVALLLVLAATVPVIDDPSGSQAPVAPASPVLPAPGAGR